MSGNWTYFPPTGGSGGGTNDYDKDSFKDYSLPANSNSGLTSTAATNPLGEYFLNDDSVKYQDKFLSIIGMTVIEDKSKWINGDITYKVEFSEPTPGIVMYATGNVILRDRGRWKELYLQTIPDAVGVSGVARRVQFVVMPNANTTTAVNATYSVDGSSLGSVDVCSAQLPTAAGFFATVPVARFPVYKAVSLGSLQTKDIHDYRLTATTAGSFSVVGIVVYNENATSNIDINPGRTYINKAKVETTPVTAAAVPSSLSASFMHLGGVYKIAKTTGVTYAISSYDVPLIASACSGSTNTNLVSVAVGTGSSYPIGSGILVQQGVTYFRGFVTNQSSDVLTVSPTLSFGFSGATLMRAFSASSTQTIDSTIFESAYSWNPLDSYLVGINNPARFANSATSTIATSFKSPDGNYLVELNRGGLVPGATAAQNFPAWGYTGGSFSLVCYGDFQAAEIEYINQGASFAATFIIQGQVAFGRGSTIGVNRMVAFSNAGVGNQAFRVDFVGSANAQWGISRVNFYKYKGASVPLGELARLEQMQTVVASVGFTNNTQCSFGSVAQYPIDQWAMTGSTASWEIFTDNSSTATRPFYAVASAGLASNHADITFFGDRFAVRAIQGGSYLATINGASYGVALNTIVTAPSFGPNVLSIIPQGVTISLHGLEVFKTFRSVKQTRGLPYAVGSDQIAPRAVQTRHLADYSVTPDKLASQNMVVSANSGNLSTTSTAQVVILSVTITVSGKRPVYVGLRAGPGPSTGRIITNPSSTNGSAVLFYILRQSQVISIIEPYVGVTAQAPVAQFPPSSIWYLDVPQAGTHTYELSWAVSAINMAADLQNAELVAIEI